MEIKNAIRLLNLENKPVCIHASMGSFGCRVSGLLDAFLFAGCTVLVPSFTDMFEAPPVPRWMPENNGAGDYSYFMEKEYAESGVYTPQTNELTVEEMGIFSQMVLAHPERMRGNNALNSFASVGKYADELVRDQTNEDVYAPLRRLYEMDGLVLLIGTDLCSATAIHYAEQLADRKPFIRWSKDASGNTIPVRAGGCSDGFEKLAPVLAPYEKRITVHQSLWRCYRVRDLVDVCMAAFLRDPMVAHCADRACARCNDAAKGGPKVVF